MHVCFVCTWVVLVPHCVFYVVLIVCAVPWNCMYVGCVLSLCPHPPSVPLPADVFYCSWMGLWTSTLSRCQQLWQHPHFQLLILTPNLAVPTLQTVSPLPPHLTTSSRSSNHVPPHWSRLRLSSSLWPTWMRMDVCLLHSLVTCTAPVFGYCYWTRQCTLLRL